MSSWTPVATRTGKPLPVVVGDSDNMAERANIADQALGGGQDRAAAAIKRLDAGDGVLVITDVKGGTPANCCNRLADAGRVEVIAGISLPMLLRAITYRRDTLDVVVEMALAGAQSGAVRVDNRIRVGEA